MSSISLAFSPTIFRKEVPAVKKCAIGRSSFHGHILGCTPLVLAPLHPSLAARRPMALTRAKKAEGGAQASDGTCNSVPAGEDTRRGVMVNATLTALAGCAALTAGAGFVGTPVASALPGFKKELKKKRDKIPEELYTALPSGLKYYDVTVGTGAGPVERGQRITVHYDAKWRNITFVTSRQGAGVTGGVPFGFDVGTSELGKVLKGLDQGVIGMRVGGQRKLLVPPELAYGESGAYGGEIPPNATIDIDVELLSIKQDARGYQVKLVEG